jgi:3-keto-disaccharide hydrolase
MPRARYALILTATITILTSLATAQQRQRPAPDDQGPTFLDPRDAGPDYVTQGEYLTDPSAQRKFGVQVAALGHGHFEVVVLPGGLPGDGWDASSQRIVLTALGEEGKPPRILPWNGYTGSFSEGAMTLKSPEATVKLKKIERQSPRAGAKPPEGATVLFDGKNADAWENGHVDSRGLLQSGTKTKKKYQDFVLHVEFLLPFKPESFDQGRGNSGIYIQDRYEVQVLDSFAETPHFNGCAAMYRQHSPSINACYPPLQWQTYDIDFHAAKFDASGKKTKNAVVTVIHNGVTVQDHYELTAKTGAGAPEGPTPGSIQLQGHNNPVFYRNIWVVEK